MALETIDIWVAAAYAVFIFILAQWVSREKEGDNKDTSDYFLAGRSLPWWAIGSSLIAANISAEQIIGMSGSAYVMGLAIASYEWMSAITLILVGKYFLPIFLKHKIYTMPQYLEQRYDSRVRMIMAIFWLGVYVLVNLTSILWLGALAINSITGIDINIALIALGVFTGAYSLYGGLKAVAFTDIIQVVLLVAGGLMIAYIALDQISGGGGVVAGFTMLLDQVPEKFDMILSKDNPSYMSLPGISVLLGGMWVMNLSYWGFNQYIIQRALAAKNIREAQKGIVFAAFLKLLMPVLVVLPGIAAAVLMPQLSAPDQAYPETMKLLPAGIKGVVFAALIAAIVSSLASMTNSIATIFTMDLFVHISKKDHNQKQLVTIGRSVSLAALVLAMVVAKPLLGGFDQAFQYIQEFTGFFTPGIVVIFLLGMFWGKTTATAALLAALGSAILSLSFKLWWPELPFMDRVGLVFILCVGIAVIISLVRPATLSASAVDIAEVDFSTSSGFNLAAVAISLVLAGFYIAWW
jgi:solute:Na+ symporter, SSS family